MYLFATEHWEAYISLQKRDIGTKKVNNVLPHLEWAEQH